MKKIVISLLILCLILSSVFVTIGTKENINNEIADDFDIRIKNQMQRGHMPSLVACIVKNDTLAWSEGYGYYDYYNHKNATVNITYPIASVTKSVTATAIMQIIENESYDVNLDDNVSEYLPFDLKNPKYPDVNITFRMLLAHQSSLNDTTIRFLFLFTLLKIPFNLNSFKNYLIEDGLFYKSNVWKDYGPGKGVCYTTQGTNILGHLIENITKQSYTDYCQKHIFIPLKMNNTSFKFSDYDKEQLARLYIWMAMAGCYLKQPYIESSSNYAGGGLKTTISDFTHFLIMHTSGGVYDGVRILSEESVEEMHRAQYPDTPDGKYLYGLGWYQYHNTSENETYGGHTGVFQGARAVMRMRYSNDSDEVGILFFWNQNSFFRSYFDCVRPEQKDARIEIEKALFEKADEL